MHLGQVKIVLQKVPVLGKRSGLFVNRKRSSKRSGLFVNRKRSSNLLGMQKYVVREVLFFSLFLSFFLCYDHFVQTTISQKLLKYSLSFYHETNAYHIAELCDHSASS